MARPSEPPTVRVHLSRGPIRCYPHTCLFRGCPGVLLPCRPPVPGRSLPVCTRFFLERTYFAELGWLIRTSYATVVLVVALGLVFPSDTALSPSTLDILCWITLGHSTVKLRTDDSCRHYDEITPGCGPRDAAGVFLMLHPQRLRSDPAVTALTLSPLFRTDYRRVTEHRYPTQAGPRV